MGLAVGADACIGPQRVKTPPYNSNYKRGTDVKLRAGHARPLRGGKQKGCTRKTVCSLKLFNSYRGIFCGACARY